MLKVSPLVRISPLRKDDISKELYLKRNKEMDLSPYKEKSNLLKLHQSVVDGIKNSKKHIELSLPPMRNVNEINNPILSYPPKRLSKDKSFKLQKSMDETAKLYQDFSEIDPYKAPKKKSAIG